MILKYITPKKNTHAREQKEVRNRLNESLKQKLRVKRIGNITNVITVNRKIFLNLVYIQCIFILITPISTLNKLFKLNRRITTFFIHNDADRM